MTETIIFKKYDTQAPVEFQTDLKEQAKKLHDKGVCFFYDTTVSGAYVIWGDVCGITVSEYSPGLLTIRKAVNFLVLKCLHQLQEFPVF